jgi:hypothetical protein
MPHWLLKSAVQRCISWLPNPQACNEWFQSRVTRSLGLNADGFAERLAAGQRHVAALCKHRPGIQDFTALEVGTGWYPTVPIAVILCGASKVWSFDIDSLLSAARVERVLRFFVEFERTGQLREILPNAHPERMAWVHAALAAPANDPRAWLAELGIHALVRDARQTELPERAIDFFFSHSVLQYIPRPAIDEMFAEFRRVARPEAVHSHFVLLMDQFSLFDRRLSAFHFLRYPERIWQWLDSPLIPQTRLRISDYRAVLTGSGWRLLEEDNRCGDIDDLRRVPLASRFRHYPEADLLVISTWLTATTG